MSACGIPVLKGAGVVCRVYLGLACLPYAVAGVSVTELLAVSVRGEIDKKAIPRTEILSGSGSGIFVPSDRWQFALGLEALARFVEREPRPCFHKCVLAVLAMELEPVESWFTARRSPTRAMSAGFRASETPYISRPAGERRGVQAQKHLGTGPQAPAAEFRVSETPTHPRSGCALWGGMPAD